MGLLTGFSILSGVEIVYFLLRFLCISFLKSVDSLLLHRFFMSLRVPKAQMVSSVNKRFGNHLTRREPN